MTCSEVKNECCCLQAHEARDYGGGSHPGLVVEGWIMCRTSTRVVQDVKQGFPMTTVIESHTGTCQDDRVPVGGQRVKPTYVGKVENLQSLVKIQCCSDPYNEGSLSAQT